MAPRKRLDKSSYKVQDKTHSAETHRTDTDSDSKTSDFKPEQQFPIISYKRIIARLVIVFVTMVVARYLFEVKTGLTVSVSDTVEKSFTEVICSDDYASDRILFKECITKKCGRVVMDNVVTRREGKELLRIAKDGIAVGHSSGGAAILDLHSGAVSMGEKFVNIYKVINEGNDIFTDADFKLYSKIRKRIQSTIATQFHISQSSLYLTKPTFFSKMTSKEPKTVHDEYWHNHVDKETYGSFDYTCLLYLTDMGTDFMGGQFIFKDKDSNHTVEPKLGRLSFFTSASENTHRVERVTSGVRYALTVSFTCDPSKAIKDPTLKSTS